MLVLSRKPGEKIHIGNLVTITIVRIGPNTVRLGIDAPREMNIVRDELHQLGKVISTSGGHSELEITTDTAAVA